MLNTITIMGRLVRDPELRRTQSGTAVCSFTVAVDRDFQAKDGGERQTDFIDVVAWRQTGEFVSKYFQKGSMIAVSGRLQIRDYTDRDGNKRTAAEIVADNVYFGESKRRDDGYQDNGGYQRGGYQDNGGYQQRSSRQDNGGSYRAPSRDSFESARQQARDGGFAEMDGEDDGDLPF